MDGVTLQKVGMEVCSVKQRKYAIVSILLLVCVSLLVMKPFKEDIWDSNFKMLKNEDVVQSK